ncbi:MAG: NAD-dependent epimerase/dehydratase family protein, partial [Deltaproteobacteria bacterium]
GPRGVYDEAKRYAEAIVTSYARVHGTKVQLARIFNTYGPRMRVDDGRVIPAFAAQAIAGEDFTVFGDGSQTRSFCYVDDLVEGFLVLWKKGDGMPINLGNEGEFTLLELADVMRRVAGSGGKVRSTRPLPENDPKQRRPDLTRARTILCARRSRISARSWAGPSARLSAVAIASKARPGLVVRGGSPC